MKGLQITLFIIAFIILSTQSFRHVYVKWIEPTGSVLDKYNEEVEKDIESSKTLDELIYVFERNDITVNLFHIEKTDPKKIDTSHTIGLGAPVAEQGTFPLVWDFVKNMPQAKGTLIFMVDTMMMFSGGIVGPIRKILNPKGYKPIGAREICMPNNLFPQKIDEEKNKEKVRKGLIRAEKYAEDIISGRSRWRRVPILSDFMGYFSKADWAWKSLRKHYRLAVDELKCIQCGLCESLCPVDNIIINDYPAFRGKCTICMRCISFCPRKAIARIKTKHEIYQAVNVKELID